MVTKKEIQKVIDPRARWLAKDNDSNVWWFTNEPEANVEYNRWFVNLSILGCLGKIKVAEFEDKDWADCCVELEPDYREWVGKLCKFWNCNSEPDELGILGIYDGKKSDFSEYPYNMRGGVGFVHCRPVKPEEVEFVDE